jgi:CubicO group peptidase (beta-lactamase class C family)
MFKFSTLILATAIVCQVKTQSLYFPPTTGIQWDTLSPESLEYCPSKIERLYAFLDTNNTKAFVLLKDGKIVLEKYFGSHNQSALWQWASAGKTITSFVVGIAQQEGFLSINDKTSKFLGQGWTNCTLPQEEKITIHHQLTMTSGLDEAVADPFCTLDSCLKYKANAGTRWAYHNGPYTLLDRVIENATGQTLNSFATQKLKNQIGMTGSFVRVGYNNVFFSNARSMARFGLLILNKGNWNGIQILKDTNYFKQMTTTSQSINNSYGYLWWLNGKQNFMIPSSQILFPGTLIPNAPSDMISAMGKGGQFLNIIPSQNMVWIRMGDEPANTLVPFLLNDDIWKYINDLKCATNGLNHQEDPNQKVQLNLNPNNDILYLKSEKQIINVEILNLKGQLVKSLNSQNLEVSILISDIQKGLYFVKAMLSDGSVWNSKTVLK